jgi:hypothetical protein
MFSKDIISHLIESKWNPDGEIQISLKYLLLHELFHIILSKSKEGNLNKRCSDEATIEDTASKIIPTGSFKKPYEFTFDFISWMLNNKIKVDYTVGGTRIHVSSLSNYIKKEFYYKKKYSRKFNPFKTLKYKRGGYTLDNYAFYSFLHILFFFHSFCVFIESILASITSIPKYKCNSIRLLTLIINLVILFVSFVLIK